MNTKKSTAIIITIIMIFLLASCGISNKAENNNLTPSKSTTETEPTVYFDKNNDSSEYVTDKIRDTETLYSNITEDTTTISKVSADPSEWTKTEIVEYYINAADKSNKSAKSEQVITLKDFSINNGQYENVIDFIMPLISKFLEFNSTEKDGITGGYNNLDESDIKSAKAYKVGNNTAIEMVMVNQTDGAKGDMLEGSVGHAISVIGDITNVTRQLSNFGLPEIQISEKDTKIYYTNATVKVIINPEGDIVNGTWKYTVDINLNNYKVGNSTVENTSIVMNNIITVNGGFTK